MDRPSDKLLKDMLSDELSIESEWHLREASMLFDEVSEMRAAALEMAEQQANQFLQSAAAKEAEAEAHVQQSNLLSTLIAARLSEQGVGVVERAAKA